MTTVTFWMVALLTATKTTRDIHVPAPFEWVGELLAGLLAIVVAFAAAYTLSLAVGFDPIEQIPFRARNVAPPATGAYA